MAFPINMFGVDSLDFANLGLGKYAFGALILFLLIYLIRPKPLERVIPSLMFLIQRRKKGKFSSFLRKLFRDPLFFLQFILLLFLCFAALEPFFTYRYDLSSENTVLVLDVSASMQADGRFNSMVKEAKDNLGGMVSAVLVKRFPTVFFEDEDPGKAAELLDTLRPSASTSNILDAIKKADELLSNRTGRIVVISDMVDTENSMDSLLQFKNYLEGKGRFVDFKIMDPVKENIGIVGMEYESNKVSLSIKNYNNEDKGIKIKSGESSQEISISANSVETVKFDVEKGVTKLEIKDNDDFMIDNEFYIHVPTNKKMKILLITNRKSGYLIDFLLSSPYITLDIVEPPRMPSIEHDVVIMYGVDKEFLLSKIVDDVSSYVTEGGALVIHAQKDIAELGIGALMPVNTLSEAAEVDAQITLGNEVTQDLVFGRVKGHLEAVPKDDAATLVAASGNALVAYRTLGMGNTMYYGIPEQSEFKVSASYPLFWNRALRFVSSFNDFDDLNRKSDEMGFDDKIGIIDLGQKTIAINLLDDRESAVTSDPLIESFKSGTGQGRSSMFVQRKMDALWYILPLIILLIIAEVFFVKYRGDI